MIVLGTAMAFNEASFPAIGYVPGLSIFAIHCLLIAELGGKLQSLFERRGYNVGQAVQRVASARTFAASVSERDNIVSMEQTSDRISVQVVPAARSD